MKSFIVKDKKDGENKSDRENSAGPETSSGEGSAKPAAAVRTPGQRRVPRHRTRVKNIEGRIRNRTFKIKRLLAQPKNVNVKKWDIAVRKMDARRTTIFPAEVRRAYY